MKKDELLFSRELQPGVDRHEIPCGFRESPWETCFAAAGWDHWWHFPWNSTERPPCPGSTYSCPPQTLWLRPVPFSVSSLNLSSSSSSSICVSPSSFIKPCNSGAHTVAWVCLDEAWQSQVRILSEKMTGGSAGPFGHPFSAKNTHTAQCMGRVGEIHLILNSITNLKKVTQEGGSGPGLNRRLDISQGFKRARTRCPREGQAGRSSLEYHEGH